MTAQGLGLGLVLGWLIGMVLTVYFRSTEILLIVAPPLAVAIAMVSYLRQLARFRRDMREVIADAFRGERPPFCFACGYDLRENDSHCCPECGQSLASTSRAE